MTGLALLRQPTLAGLPADRDPGSAVRSGTQGNRSGLSPEGTTRSNSSRRRSARCWPGGATSATVPRRSGSGETSAWTPGGAAQGRGLGPAVVAGRSRPESAHPGRSLRRPRAADASRSPPLGREVEVLESGSRPATPSPREEPEAAVATGPARRRGRRLVAFQPVRRPELPAGPRRVLGPQWVDRFVLGTAGSGRDAARPRGRPADARPSPDVRPDRAAADAGGGRRLPGDDAPTPMIGRRAAAGLAPLRRALGTPLAGPGPLCRHLGLQRRLPHARGVSLPQLRRG